MLFRSTLVWGVLLIHICLLPAMSYAADYYVSPTRSSDGNGTQSSPFKYIQTALLKAQPGDVINLASGLYKEDIRSVRNGTASRPITVTGPQNAIINGDGASRMVELNHDYIILDGFTLDGEVSGGGSESRYRDKLLYLHGKGTRDGVDGAIIRNMTITNGGGECIRLRYYARNNIIENNTITHCGVHDFVYGAGGKNGEAIYVGTSTNQLNDGKNPTSDVDVSSGNIIRNNIIMTYGNECVEFKEGATNNVARNNDCATQRDSDSAGMGSRGSGNSIIYNRICSNSGAGIRVGGHTYNGVSYGTNNTLSGNIIYSNKAGGIKFQANGQAATCGNRMSNNDTGNNVGDYGERYNAAAPCTTTLENYAGTINRNSDVCNAQGHALIGNTPSEPAAPPVDEPDTPDTPDAPPAPDDEGEDDEAQDDGSNASPSITITGTSSRLRRVTASSYDTRGDYGPLNTIDDDLDGTSRWSSKGRGEHIIYELSSTQPVKALSIAWYRGNKREAQFAVSTSADGQNWDIRIPTTTTSGRTTDYEGYLLEEPVYARFVKITGYGNTENAWTSIKEAKIYGTYFTVTYNDPPSEAPPTNGGGGTQNAAISIVDASPHDTRRGDYHPSKTLDNSLDDSSRFSSDAYRAFITYDLGTAADLQAIDIAWYKGDERRSRFIIEGSADGKSWATILNNAMSSGQSDGLERYNLFSADGLRYARIVGLGNSNDNWTSIKEVAFVEE